jgi:hypothetical protein
MIDEDAEPTLRFCCRRCEHRLGDYVVMGRDVIGVSIAELGAFVRARSAGQVRKGGGRAHLRGPRTGAGAFEIQTDPRDLSGLGNYARWKCGCGLVIKRRMVRLLPLEVHPNPTGPPIVYV